MFVTPPVSHVEMWPYVASAADWSANQAATAVLIVVSSATRGEIVGAGVAVGAGDIVGAVDHVGLGVVGAGVESCDSTRPVNGGMLSLLSRGLLKARTLITKVTLIVLQLRAARSSISKTMHSSWRMLAGGC